VFYLPAIDPCGGLRNTGSRSRAPRSTCDAHARCVGRAWRGVGGDDALDQSCAMAWRAYRLAVCARCLPRQRVL